VCCLVDAIQVFSPSPVLESVRAELPIEDSDIQWLNLVDTSSLDLEDVGPADTGTTVSAVTPNVDEMRVRRCSMCEIVRFRNPGSAGCRQCQLDVASTHSGSCPSVATARAEGKGTDI
jgi:hypothetical protein